MNDKQLQLRNLENQMRLLLQIRAETKRRAELMVKRSNVEFDNQAIPLARKINDLREEIEDEQSTDVVAPQHERREHRPTHAPSVDPEWSQEDIDHYQELIGRK